MGQYEVITPGGGRFTAPDLATLQAWVDQNRVIPTSTVVILATGQQVHAQQVPGLVFRSAPPYGNPYQNPYQQGPQANPYQNPYPSGYIKPVAGKIDDHLVKSILATVCCCLPLGVVAIVFSAQVNTAAARGDFRGAHDLAAKADTWGNWAIGLGIVSNLGWVFLSLLGNL